MQTASSVRAIALAWLVAGCLDIASAIIIWVVRGVPLVKGFQGIAAGLIARPSAFSGGLATASLGFLLHFVIMLCVVTVYFMARRIRPKLTRCPMISGAIYGIIVYLVMY